MKTFQYTNPITRGPAHSMRDHCVVKSGSRWYCTGTSQPVWGGPNPGVRLMVSGDLLHWDDAGWIIDSSELAADCPYNGRFWAPEIHPANGLFYLTVNSGHEGPQHPGRRMDDHRVWIFVSDQITGPYQLITPHGMGTGFKNDASLFTDQDGRSYLYCSGGGLWQAEIDLGSGKLVCRGDFTRICGPRDPGNPEWMIGGIEGPFVIKRHGAYWMFFSAWTRGYEIGVFRGETPLGPWSLTPNSPILGTRKRRYRESQAREGGYAHLDYADTPDPFVEIGHNAVFEGPDGSDWLCCHGLLEGKEILANEPVLQYADSHEQLCIEPLRYKDGLWHLEGPTWTPQEFSWEDTPLMNYPPEPLWSFTPLGPLGPSKSATLFKNNPPPPLLLCFMSIQLQANARAKGSSLDHFWSFCVGAGRANEGLRASWQNQLQTVVDQCGFRYIRFHGLFHDDMFVFRENGRSIYNFQYVDELFDMLLEKGIRPFVEFGFCPGDLASQKGTVFWWKGNGAPPNDYAKWGELIRLTVTHWVERYGIEEVRTWYFEVWNEPNLGPFFRGTKSQYFELYKVTAAAVKGVSPELRVGGPSTSNFVPDARFDGETEDISFHKTVLEATDLDALDWRPVWLEQFLKYCESEKLPVDFVSCHPYPTDWALDEHGQGRRSTRGVGATPRDLALLRQIMDSSAFPKAEIHLTEWSSSSSPRDFTHDYLQAATYVVKANVESIGLVNSLSYWTFTDVFEEGGAGDTIFHGGFGMINCQGIVKPTFHAYRFLNELGNEVLERFPAGIVTRDAASGRLAALAFNYPAEMPLSVPASFDSREIAREVLELGHPEMLSIELSGLEPGAPILVETLDRQHGNAMAAWEAMGSPEPPSREQAEMLRKAARETIQETHKADQNGDFILKRALAPWSVVLVKQL